MKKNQAKRRSPRYGVRVWTAGAVLACLTGLPGVTTGAESVTVVSWGGAYAKAQEKALFEPFTAESSIEVRLESYNGGLAQVRAQVETGNVHWDIVDLEFADLARGCDEGLFEFVDIDRLPSAPDGTPAREELLRGDVFGLWWQWAFLFDDLRLQHREFSRREARPPSRTISISRNSPAVGACAARRM